MQRIACAAEGKRNYLRFYLGQIPPGGGGICWCGDGERRENGGGNGRGTAGERRETLSPAPLLKGLRPLRIPLWRRIACAARGEEDGHTFLPRANPAGRRRNLLGRRWGTAGERQGTLSPAPLLKGLRPLRIPLWRRILCAASLPYKRPMTKKGNLPWYEYVYDEYYDCVLCPQDKILRYATTNREGYREYKSKGYECQECPVRERCTQNQQHTKTVTRHIWQEYLERAEDIRHSPLGKATYALRSQTIERVFADAKEKHAMRYTPYRGLTAVTAWVKLKFAAMNLKKLAIHKWRPFLLFLLFSILSPSFLYLVCQRSPFAFSQGGFFDRLCSALHALRRGGKDGLSFLPRANPAGRRRDLLVFTESSCEKVVLGEGHVPREKVSARGEDLIPKIRRYPSLASQTTLCRRTQASCRGQPSVTPPKLRVADNLPSPHPSPASWVILRRRIQTLCRGQPSVTLPQLRVADNPPSSNPDPVSRSTLRYPAPAPCRRQPSVTPPQPGVVGDPPSPNPDPVSQTTLRYPAPAPCRRQPSVVEPKLRVAVNSPLPRPSSVSQTTLCCRT